MFESTRGDRKLVDDRRSPLVARLDGDRRCQTSARTFSGNGDLFGVAVDFRGFGDGPGVRGEGIVASRGKFVFRPLSIVRRDHDGICSIA